MIAAGRVLCRGMGGPVEWAVPDPGGVIVFEQEAIKAVLADLGWRPEMPLAGHAGGVACSLESFGKCRRGVEPVEATRLLVLGI